MKALVVAHPQRRAVAGTVYPPACYRTAWCGPGTAAGVTLGLSVSAGRDVKDCSLSPGVRVCDEWS